MELDNKWSKPEGVFAPSGKGYPNRLKYRIINPTTNKVEEHFTEVALDNYTKTYHHALAMADQWYGDKVAEIIQSACAYFYASDAEYVPLKGVRDIVVSDEEVRERIYRLNLGENVREAIGHSARMHQHYDFYPLDELPFLQQRALIEQLLDWKRQNQVEIIGEVEISVQKEDDLYQ